MRTIKQLNNKYGQYGYSFQRQSKHVDIIFEGVTVYAVKGRLAKVEEVLLEMDFIGWYGIERSCELPEVCDNNTTTAPVITKSQALALGFCFQRNSQLDIGYTVYRPDGRCFYAEDEDQALMFIAEGLHLVDDEAPYCSLPTASVLSGNVPTQQQYHDEARINQVNGGNDSGILIANGYNPDEYRLNNAGMVYTLDGDVEVGSIKLQRW